MPHPDINIVHPSIEQYLSDILPDRDPILTEMETYAGTNHFPIVGPLVGRLLFSFASSIRATKIFELGSGFGYSACWFAKATYPDAKIICTDRSQDNARLAGEWFSRAGVSQKTRFNVGDALTFLESTDEEFDIIFNDINKNDYPRALTLSIPRLRKGGMFISDNVLWKGRILGGTLDDASAGVATMNRMLYSSPGLFTTIIPLRDGVSVSIKL